MSQNHHHLKKSESWGCTPIMPALGRQRLVSQLLQGWVQPGIQSDILSQKTPKAKHGGSHLSSQHGEVGSGSKSLSSASVSSKLTFETKTDRVGRLNTKLTNQKTAGEINSIGVLIKHSKSLITVCNTKENPKNRLKHKIAVLGSCLNTVDLKQFILTD